MNEGRVNPDLGVAYNFNVYTYYKMDNICLSCVFVMRENLCRSNFDLTIHNLVPSLFSGFI